MSEVTHPINAEPLRAERVAIIEAGKRELWRIYYPNNKTRLEVRRLDNDK